MTKIIKRQRFSKNEWLEAGLKMLAEQGVDKLTIGSLSRTVGVAKTSFYWHFKDRQELLDHLLDFWVHEFNLVVTDNKALLALPAEQRLHTIAELVQNGELVKYELAIRAWANYYPPAMQVFNDMSQRRLILLKQAFLDAGFSTEEQESRAQALNCYITWGGVIQADKSANSAVITSLIPILLAK